MNKKRLCISVGQDTYTVLDKIHKETNVSISFIIEVLVAELVVKTIEQKQAEKKGEN